MKTIFLLLVTMLALAGCGRNEPSAVDQTTATTNFTRPDTMDKMDTNQLVITNRPTM